MATVDLVDFMRIYTPKLKMHKAIKNKKHELKT